MKFIPCAICAALILAPLAYAQTSATWNGTSGNWSETARWSTNPFFPNNGDPAGVTYDAFINGGGVNLDVPIINENLFLNGGTFSSASNQLLTLNQKFFWTGGTVVGGMIAAAGGLVVAGTDGRIMRGGTMVNEGSGGVWEGSGGITLQTGPSFLVNDSGGTFDIRGGGGSIHRDQFHAGATLLFTNNGLLKKTVSTGDFVFGFGAALNNNAQTVVETGRLVLSGGGTSVAGSSFSVATGARILFNGDVYSLGGGTALQGADVFELSGGTLNLAGDVTAPVGQGHLEITGAGGYGGGILTGTGTLAVETIRWLGGPARVNGGTSTARTGLVIAGTDGRIMGGGTLINAGSGGVWESSGGITLAPAASGFLINDTGATFDIQGGGGSISRDQSNPAGATLVFTNNGLLKKTGSSGDFSLGFGVSFDNNSQTVVDSGRLILSGGGASAAGSSFSVASDARVLFNGAVYSLGGGTTLQGAGVFELAGGTLNLTGNVTAPVGQGHLEITGAGGYGGGVLTGEGTLAVETIRWVGGPAIVAGGISTARTGLIISGPDGHRMEGGTLINAGANGVWESSGGINLRGPSKMENAAGATFDLQGGTGGGFFREFPYEGRLIFTNDGLLKKTVSNGTFRFGYGSEVTFRNSGTTQVQTGQLSIPSIEFNRGILRASTGGILTLGGSSLDNRSGLIETLAASTIQVDENSTIIGGALNNIGGTFDFGNNVTLDGRLDVYLGSPGQNVSLSGSFPISSGRTVKWQGGINNSGVVSLESATSPATLTISGAVDLMGGGTITLGGGASSSLIQADPSAGADRLNSAQLIEGAGTVSVFLDNNALVQANVSGRELHLAGGGENIGHTMQANGGYLRLSGVFENAGGIVQSVGTELRLDSSTIRGGTIRNNSGSITMAGNRLEGLVTPVTLEGEYKIAQGLSSTFKGTIINNGLVRFENATSASTLRIEGSVSLIGSESLSLEGPLSRIDPSLDVNTDKILNSLRIRGHGTIAVKIDNLAGGVIDADIAGGTLIVSQTLTNTGALSASNNTTLTLSGGGSSTQPILAGPTSVLNFSGNTFTLDGGANLIGAGIARITAGLLAIGNDAGDIVAVGKLALGGGDLGGPGRLDVAASLDWSLGNILGTGPVNLLSGSYSVWTGAGNALSARVLNNAGFIGWNKSSVTGSDGAILNNAVGGNISFQGDHQFVQSSDGAVFNNAGIFGKGVGAGTATVGTQFNNTGFVHAQSGTLYFSGGGTQSGEFRASGLLSAIAFNGNHLIKAGASFTGDGLTRATGGTMTFGESAADQFALAKFEVSGSNVAGPGSLFISNSMNWNSGFIGGSGAVELLAGSSSIWNPTSGIAWSGRTLNNSGAITQQNYFFLNNAAQFNNFGSYSVQGDHAIYGDAGAVFSNSGTLTKTSGAGTASFELPFHNSGLVESQSGRFNMNSGGTHTGVFKMSSGATISFNGVHFLKSAAVFQGGGIVLIGSDTTTFGENSADAYSLANLKVTGGDVAGPASLNITNSLNWSGATIRGSSVINLAAGSASVWNGSSSILNGRTLHNYGTTTLSRNLTLGGDAVIHNFGNFELQGAPIVFAGASGGTFINTGTLTKTGTSVAAFTTVFNNGNAGLVQVNSGALHLTGGGTHQGDFVVNGTSTVLRLASGENQLNGSKISGTGAVELSGSYLRVASGGAIIESRLRLQTNSIVTGPGQLDVSSVTWTDGTMSDTGRTLVVPGGTMTISGSATKNIEKRTLENQGALTWSGDGILRAQDGGRLVNFGQMTITGNGTFDGLPGSPNPGAFINAVGGTVTKSNATGVTIFDGEFVNNGTANFSGVTALTSFTRVVRAAPSQSVQLKMGSSGSGDWFYDNVIVEWFLGLFGGGNQQLNNSSQATVRVASGQNFQVNASLTLKNASSMKTHGGGNIVASGGGNIKASGGGNLSSSGGNLIANDGGTLIANDGGTLIANDGGSLIANDGGTLIANDGGTLIANDGGSLIANDGGTLIANDGGTLIANDGGSIIANDGGTLIANDGGTLIGHNGSAIAAHGGNSLLLNKLSSLSANPPTSGIMAGNNGRIVGKTGGLFVGDVYALSGGSLLPGDIGAAGIMSINGNLTLDTGSKLIIDLFGPAQGTDYDLLDVNAFETRAGSVHFDGNLLLSMLYGLRNWITETSLFTILTSDSPITGIIGNLLNGRVTTTDGFGSFAVTTADAGSDLVLTDFEAAPLTYALWTTAYEFIIPADELFAADPDRDGMCNGLEYGLGSDPLTADAEVAPRVSLTEAIPGSGVRYLTLTYERPIGVNRPVDLAWNVQRNTGLAATGWSADGMAAEVTTSNPGSVYETVIVRSQSAVVTDGPNREFLRLAATKL